MKRGVAAALAQQEEAPRHRSLAALRSFDRFETYTKALVRSRDVDPVYPFIKAIVRAEGFEPEWFVFVYTAYYHLGSAVRLCRQIPESRLYSKPLFSRLVSTIRKFSSERRGTMRRPEVLVTAIEAWLKARPTVLRVQERKDARAMRALFKSLPFQGDWASFKLTELHEKALGHPNLAPPDMDIASRSVNQSLGPAGGARCLYGEGVQYPQEIAQEWEHLGKSLSRRWGFGLGEVETSLCKWSKVCKGQYFIGHDIYEFRHFANLWPRKTFAGLMRSAGFADELWVPDLDVKKAKRAYLDRRELLNAHFAQGKKP